MFRKTQNLKIVFIRSYHSNGSSHTLRRKIVPELCPDNSTVTMWSGYLSPDYSNLGSFFVALSNSLLLCSVNISYTLAQVKVSFFPFINSINSKKGSVGLLVSKPPLVTKYNAF